MFSSGKPSKSKFATQLCAAIAKLDGQQKYRYDPEIFRLVHENGNGVINLSNMYQEHCSLPRAKWNSNLHRLASIFASSLEEIPQTFEEAKPHLRPKIWSRATFDFMELKSLIDGGKVPDLPLDPLGSHLYSSLVYDTVNSMRSVSNEDLSNWGTTFYEALEIACDRLQGTTMAIAKIGDGFHSSVSGDNYDSARILLVGRRNFDVVGDEIVTGPHRDAMYLAGSKDEVSLKILFGLTAKAAEVESRPLSPLPLRLVDGEWQDWTPPKNHVLRGQYDDLELPFLGGLYSEQKEILDILLGEKAIFVASFAAVQKKDSEKLLSYCVWSRNVDSLLPRTQVVVFLTGGSVVASGEWDHVADIVRHLMVADETYYPVRYRVPNFPSNEQLAAIGRVQPFAD